MLNTTRLRILREVATRGTAAAAAKALYLTPPAVTYQLAALEKEVGVPLLDRSAHSLRLTNAGMRLVQHADTILANCELALADVQTLSNEIRGTVRLSVFRAAAGGVTLAALLSLGREYPELEVLTSTLDPERAVSELRTGQLDIAVSYEWRLTPRPRTPGVDRHALFTEPMVLLLPPGHPIPASARLQDLANERWCIAQDEEHGRLVFEHVAHAHGFEPKVAFESDHFRAIASAVEAGIGVGLVPLLTDLRGVDVTVLPLAEPQMDRRVFAAVRPGSVDTPAIRAVLDALSAPACALMTSATRRATPLATQESDHVVAETSGQSAEDEIDIDVEDEDHVPPALRDEWYMED